MILGEPVRPDRIVAAALQARCASISYTYTEPTIFIELAYETAKLASAEGLKNVFVTNGYITAEALREIQPYLHAANIDLKGFTDAFYREICGARLQPVLDSIRLYRELGIWIEITTLVIPGHNDSESELRHIAEFIRSVDRDIPWHVSRFHPTYKLTDRPRTPVQTLKRAREIGMDAGLRFVYEGNVPGEGEDTLCANCRRTIVKRYGFTIEQLHVKDGTCEHCGVVVAGVWG
jgi:pyruvate formate lyase activating enzyme